MLLYRHEDTFQVTAVRIPPPAMDRMRESLQILLRSGGSAMNREELVQRAAQIARAKASLASGRRTNIRDFGPPETAVERRADKQGDLAKRLAAYQEALQAAADEDPPCPDCWIGQEELAMAPIASETLDEVQFGCMDCGFEVSFPARAARHWAHPHRRRKGSRAA
jgi:hypothetical protein